MKQVKIQDPIRLQKFLSQKGVCSRRMAEEFIVAGKILINGKKAVLGNKVTDADEVQVNGKVISGENERVYFRFYKPKGVQCTLKYLEGKKTLTMFNFGTRVFPVGRLDQDSHGLLMMTNDGDMAHKLMHPSFQHEKEYEVRVDQALPPHFAKIMENGMLLDGEKKKTAKCEVAILGERGFRIILKEGRNRQIRRMCEQLGLMVTDLKRIRVSNVLLGNLGIGKWEKIPENEIKKLKSSLG